MTILTSFTLVVLIILASLFIAYNVQKGTKTLQEFKDNYYNNEEVQQVADLATELYNKELRPVALKKTIKNIELDIEVTPEQATVNVEATVEVVKPAKKKRKYYPKKPKTSI